MLERGKDSEREMEREKIEMRVGNTSTKSLQDCPVVPITNFQFV